MVDFSANVDLFSRIEPMELYQDQGISVSLSGKLYLQFNLYQRLPLGLSDFV